jgi:hypothetical protein
VLLLCIDVHHGLPMLLLCIDACGFPVSPCGAARLTHRDVHPLTSPSVIAPCAHGSRQAAHGTAATTAAAGPRSRGRRARRPTTAAPTGGRRVNQPRRGEQMPRKAINLIH